MPLEQTRTLLHSLLILVLLLTPLVGLQHSLSSECHAVLSGSSPDPGSSPISAPAPGLAASCLPWRIEWWEEAARLSLLAGNAEDAFRYLERGKNEARRIGRENGAELSVNAEIDLAVSQQALGEPLQAIETWKRIAARVGLTEQVAARLVELHILRGDYPAAIAVLQMLSHAQPENAEVHSRLGFLLATQDPEKSLPHFEKAAELNPSLKRAPQGSNRQSCPAGSPPIQPTRL